MLIRADGAKIIEYPYSFDQLRQEHPDTSFPREPTNELLAEFGVYPVVETARPEPKNPATKRVEEGRPKRIKGVWTQTWTEVPISDDEQRVRARISAETAHRDAIRSDGFFVQLAKLGPTQIADYVEASVTDLASAKQMLAKLAQAVAIAIRREFR